MPISYMFYLTPVQPEFRTSCLVLHSGKHSKTCQVPHHCTEFMRLFWRVLNCVHCHFCSTFTSACSSRRKKKILTMLESKHCLDLIDIYRLFHLKAAEYSFFSSTLRTLCRMDHMLDLKTNLSIF